MLVVLVVPRDDVRIGEPCGHIERMPLLRAGKNSDAVRRQLLCKALSAMPFQSH